MPKKKATSWRQVLEDRFIPVLTAAAKAKSKHVRYVEFDFVNSEFRVIVENWPSTAERNAISLAIELQGRAIAPQVVSWRVYVRRPFPYPFTVHLATMPQELKSFDQRHDLTVFQIELDQLLAQRDAEAKIFKLAEQFDYVGAFALGGTAPLLHLASTGWNQEKVEHPNDIPNALDQFAKKYHLFPGLQWNPKAKETFLKWFVNLPTDSTVLFFDTGTKGNGPREIANTLRQACAKFKNLPRMAHIVGIVDGKDPAQKTTDEQVVTAGGGHMRLAIDYLTVTRVMSEDCQILIGYDRNREFSRLQPLRDNGLVRIVDAQGQAIQIIGASSASSTFHALMTNAQDSTLVNVGQRLSKTREIIIAATILEYEMNGEFAELHNAWAWGFLTNIEFDAVTAQVIDRYKRAIEDYGGREWDFNDKKVRRRKPPSRR